MMKKLGKTTVKVQYVNASKETIEATRKGVEEALSSIASAINGRPSRVVIDWERSNWHLYGYSNINKGGNYVKFTPDVDINQLTEAQINELLHKRNGDVMKREELGL